MPLNQEQLEILKAIGGGSKDETQIVNELNMPRHSVRYNLSELKQEGYVKGPEGNIGDGNFMSHISSYLTPKGKTALEEPNKIVASSDTTQNFYGNVGNVANINTSKQQTVQHNYASHQAIAQIEASPTFKQRTVAALTAGGMKAFEKAIDNPVAAFVVGAIEELKKS